MTKSHAAIVAVGAILLTAPAASQPQFRAGTEVVTVDVLVRTGNVPVTDLRASDFELRDNGVVQQIEVSRANALPVDLTLLLDVSSSVRSAVNSFKSDIRQLGQFLRPRDQVRLLAFSGTTTRVFGFQPGNAPLSFEGLQEATGTTALDDALMLSMAWAPEAQRRHLVAVFTDGGENGSVIERGDLLAAAARAPGLMYVAMPRPIDGPVVRGATGATFSFTTQGGATLRATAEATGGGLIISERSSRILDGFQTVFQTFRSGYVLYYTPRGVARPGWHELSVTVTKPGKYEVHARKGYAGG